MTAIDSCTTRHCFLVVPSVHGLAAFQVRTHGSRSAHKLALFSQESHVVTEEYFAMLTFLLLLTWLACFPRCNMTHVIPVLYMGNEMDTGVANGLANGFTYIKIFN